MQSLSKKQPFTEQELSIMNKIKKKKTNVFDGAHKMFKKKGDYMDNNDVLGNLKQQDNEMFRRGGSLNKEEEEGQQDESAFFKNIKKKNSTKR